MLGLAVTASILCLLGTAPVTAQAAVSPEVRVLLPAYAHNDYENQRPARSHEMLLEIQAEMSR